MNKYFKKFHDKKRKIKRYARMGLELFVLNFYLS